MSEMFVESLCNRIGAINTLYERCVSDMTLEQVNYQERAGVLPIAFSLSHYIRSQDQSISGPFLGEAALWESGGWAEKVGVTVDKLGLGSRSISSGVRRASKRWSTFASATSRPGRAIRPASLLGRTTLCLA